MVVLATEGGGKTRAVQLLVCVAFSALCFFGAVLSTSAQLASHEAHEVIGQIPREILERAIPIRQGIGAVHEKVTTASPEAQAFYDQGLTYLYSYVWLEAARSFYQALQLDPKLAMAYLGLADAYVGLKDLPQGRAALQKAEGLAAEVADRERRRIEIGARRLEFAENSQDYQKYLAYRRSVDDALLRNPTDPWLWVWRGFANEGTPFGRGQAGAVDSIAFYETVLALSPDNSAAHHYLIHSFENIGRTKEALEQSEAYLRLAPAIPHAHHMRGHELRRAGRTEEALQEFRKADELENAYYRSERIPAEYDWHHAHNLSLLAMCYQALGQMKHAEQALREAFSLPAYIDLQEFNRREWPEFLLDRSRPQEALEASQTLMKSKWALGRFIGHTLVGRAMLAMGRIEEATDELAQAEREMGLSPGIKSDGVQPSVGLSWLSVYADALRAEILLREKKWAEGAALMKQVEEQLRAGPGPDDWSAALFRLESIARLARETNDWELAEFTAKEIIQQDPGYAGGHYSLALVAENRGDATMAHHEFAQAEKLWSRADPDLPELRYVHKKLAMGR